jgi:hypothetical protein
MLRHKPPKPKPKEVRHKKPGPDSPYEIMHETRKLVRLLIKQGDTIMSALTDLQAKVDELTTAIAEEKTEVQGMLTDLKAQVKALQDQIAAGGTVTDADLVAVSTQIDATIAQVKGISDAV